MDEPGLTTAFAGDSRCPLRFGDHGFERLPLGTVRRAWCAVVAQGAKFLLDLMHYVVRVNPGEALVEGDDNRVPAGVEANPASPSIGDPRKIRSRDWA